MKLLLVEDSATYRHALGKILEDQGHKVISAKSGEEALQLLSSHKLDMILMDLDMPGLDGFETTQLIRETLERWIPILILSGRSDDESVINAIECGADDYLLKPISPVLLQAKIIAMERLMIMHQSQDRLNNELSNLSQFDGLTQLNNRRSFLDRAEQSLAICHRSNQPASLLMFDVDHFKRYNDFYGHPEGDKCLQRLSTAFQSVVQRDSDLLGRYGGEEFIALLNNTDEQQAKFLAEQILKAVAELAIPHEKSSVAPIVSLSIGVACSRSANSYSLPTLIERADQHLYQAKQNGRNQVVVTQDSSQRIILLACVDSQIRRHFARALRSFGNIVTADSYSEKLELTAEVMPDWVVFDHSCQAGTLSSDVLIIENLHGDILARLETNLDHSPEKIQGDLANIIG